MAGDLSGKMGPWRGMGGLTSLSRSKSSDKRDKAKARTFQSIEPLTAAVSAAMVQRSM